MPFAPATMAVRPLADSGYVGRPLYTPLETTLEDVEDAIAIKAPVTRFGITSYSRTQGDEKVRIRELSGLLEVLENTVSHA